MNMTELHIAYRTIVVREIRRFARIWQQTLLPPAITIALYFVIFGTLIGPRIGDMSGFSYIEFVVPGLIMMSVITNAYGNVVSSFYGSKFQRNIEELLVSPVPNIVILLGYVTGGVARGLSVGLIVTLLSLFFTQLQIHSLLTTVTIVFLTAILFSLAGFINAIFAGSFDDISIIPTFVLTPLTYLGGVFYSINMLPGIWQKISLLNPVVYLVSGFRWSFYENSDVSITTSVVMITVFMFLCLAIIAWIFKTGFRLKN